MKTIDSKIQSGEMEKNTVTLNAHPDQIIPEGEALCRDSRGFIRPLVSGEPFAGFSMTDRTSRADKTTVVVLVEGVVDILVDRLDDVVVGAPVFATSPRNFTTAYRSGGDKLSEIGRIAEFIGQRRAKVTFSV